MDVRSEIGIARQSLLALLQDFDRVLASEYEALRARDVDGLESAVARKQELVGEIAETSRHCPLPAAGDDIADDPSASAEWGAIRGLLARCALANRTNGAAVDASRSFVNSLLDLMTGRPPGSRLYDARGRVGDTGRRRSWDSV
jgi:flagellar biosynthesis/type III secretory pathway chaperone